MCTNKRGMGRIPRGERFPNYIADKASLINETMQVHLYLGVVIHLGAPGICAELTELIDLVKTTLAI